MKTTIKYIIRAICALVGMVAFVLLIGEPTEEITLANCIVLKGVSLLALWGVFKAYMLTLSEEERKEIEDERV
jgi:hypothetical protein